MSNFNPLSRPVVVGAIDGYLQSVRRVTDCNSDYGAYLIDGKLDLKTAINSFLCERLENYEIDESGLTSEQKVDEILRERIFSRITFNDKSIKEVMEFDLLDYFNLLCSKEQESNVHKNGAKYVDIKNDFYKDLKIMIFKLDHEESLLIFLGDR